MGWLWRSSRWRRLDPGRSPRISPRGPPTTVTARPIVAARERLAREPGDGDSWQRLGTALAAVGEYQAAIAAYEQARDGAGEPVLRARVAAARLGLKFGDRGASEQTLRELLQDHQSRIAELSASQRVALAEAAVSLAAAHPKHYAEALDLYEQAIRGDPANIRARVGIGDLLLDRYNSAEAMAAYEEALELDETDIGTLYGIARSHERKWGQSRMALTYANKP